ncbi:2-amino-4-hydroxy-6-hydroxymethyldihydropteridine diphosphokinase [Fluviicola sp.]|jgi:2-amino-4-hydroxy-6-hydroxymethyldihydropteridine diphosphokinase|uniref:2-amino-4-hydroxy-6- hydroxymethyldihydropteridine diphosphokinase n=1 Tax=Fluviicola sp. TaxID=1917219 RepID=UPI00282BC430|nr:2-amino-4-hydroxy-6-hydroxymethyldihydropteridine diphosphokinase [Fluviicola sp.]MDR0802169.1 2-amino-4-hydroxy-6-hydroxymethyldihydropteridine diphosphokinase [Fluviicola sp.]
MAKQKKKDFNELIYIGVGTNMGNKLANIRHAIDELNTNRIHVIRTASVYETPPWGFMADEWFLNTVFECTSELMPQDCLKALQFVEKKMGRERNLKEGYESRIIDLDILLFKDLQINTPELTVPHPYIIDRPFVISPMFELTQNFFFYSLEHDFEELKNKSENPELPFVVYYPPLVNE